MNKINRIILCVIDDVRSKHFFDFIDKGLLPNFKKLMENGLYSKNCITDFPSITYPTQISINTGTYTGDYRKELCHGIPLAKWMGRDTKPPFLRDYASKNMQIYKLNEDVGNNCQTILEMVGDENTASISQFLIKGAKYFFPERKTKLAMLYLLLMLLRNRKRIMIRANSIIIQKLLETFKSPKKFFDVNEPPIASLICFISSDLLMHVYGFDSKIYKLNLLHIDKVIGYLIKKLDEMGYLNDTAIAITSDHGNYKAKKVGDLTDFFIANKLTHYHPHKNRKGNMDLAEYGGVGFFNFKGKVKSDSDKFWSRPTIKELENYGKKRVNLLKELFNIKGTQLMYYRDDENTNKNGKIYLKRKYIDTNKIITGIIEYRGTGHDYKTKYIIENDENDVFNYLTDPKASKLIDGKFHSINEWLAATSHLDFPLYPDLIPRHFKNPRSCNIILSNEGTIIYNIEHGKKKKRTRYFHDIGLRKSSVVPLIIGGSLEIPHKEVQFCKIVDIVPTLLKFLGKTPHRSVIGESLV